VASFLARNGLLLAVLLAVPLIGGAFWAYQIGLYLIYAIAAVGLGLAWGQAGILSLGQGLFVGLAAYISALILKGTTNPILMYLGLPAAIIAAGTLAFAVAAIVFKGRMESGPAFSLITLALALSGFQIATSWTAVTGGFNGLIGVPGLPGIDGILPIYFLTVGALVPAVAAADWLERAPIGTLWRAVAQDERRLAFLGYGTALIKAAVFAVAAAFAGLAGAIYAPQQNLVTPDLTGFAFSGSLVVFAAVGGRFTILGPVLGAVVVGVLSAELRERVLWWELVVGLFFIVVVLRFPGGLISLFNPLARLFPSRNVRPKPSEAPPKHAFTTPLSAAFEDVRVKLGDVTILDGLSLATGDEGLLCVIGPNGAGKTSTLNVLTGALPKGSGRILIGDEEVRHPTPTSGARRGVGRKFQTPTVFPNLTIGENLAIALWSGRVRWWHYLRPSLYGWTSPVLREVQRRFRFLESYERKASDLSHGERQVLELTMAVCAEPRLLLLDEPCAGLSHQETAAVVDLIRWAREHLKLRIIIIEHDMELVRQLADRVVVLHQGRLLAHGTIEEVQADPAVRAVYVGGTR
jgi:branched-chain amino acid transport system permease protein